MGSFKAEKTFEERLKESSGLREKHPDKLPVIVERTYKAGLPELDKKKFLVPDDFTLGKFSSCLIERLHVPPSQAVFLFVGKVLPPNGATMMLVYEEHKDKDGFLYITYSSEDTYG